ncbi:MAG TPA: Gfo/Idh/MocA family oxidoreductase [Blastocatellia bacterium]|jgi:predicted dehydrogenase|nr:Gfo/Idh/MocA family oxidoreductase [Blastocatellia bacterium]
MAKKSTRREFIAQATAGAAALSAGGSLISAKAEERLEEMINARQAPATGRVLGANDRVNFGFIGMGGRMGEHTGYVATRNKNQGDVQAVAVCDIYEKNKRRGQAQTKVSDKDIHHDYRELCARKDVDAVVIATPDHWHTRHAMEALNSGKHVYLEKPMTYTIDEARDLARRVKATGLQLQVGSQHLSDIQHWKAREVIQSGLIGKILWASTSYSRNTPIGEWNYYKIDPDEEANEKTIDWKAFLGYAKKRPFDKDRFFRWRKYWDYSGGIATDLFYHRLSPLMFSIGSPEFPTRVTAQGGIFAPVEGDIREVPDTYITTIEFPGKYAVMLGSSMLNATGIPEMIRGTKGSIYLKTREFQNNSAIRVVPERPYREEFSKKTGGNELVIDVSGNTLGGEGAERPTVQFTTHHMANFINAIRGTENVHFDAELGYKAMVAIRLGVDAYRSGQTMYFDAKREKATTRPMPMA